MLLIVDIMEQTLSDLMLFNGRVVLRDRVVEDGVVLVESGRIRYAGSREEAPPLAGGTRVDLEGAIVGPGFVDVHCHGGGAAEAFDAPSEFMDYHLAGGTTSMLPTLGYNRMEPGSIELQLERFLKDLPDLENSTFVGFHLEGPYMNRKYGALADETPMRLPEEAEYGRIIERFGGEVKLWSFAPELEGADTFIRAAVAAGIRLAIGHSEATAKRVLEVAGQGVSQACHALNATGLMPPPPLEGVRQPGLDEAVLVCDSIVAEVIPDRDGAHVHPLFLQLLYRAKGPERLIIITDCTSDQERTPRSPGDDVHYNYRGQLSGSRLRMVEAASNFLRHTGCSLPEVFRMAALNPAKVAGLDHDIGSLEPGKRANLVVLDRAMALRGVYLSGRRVAGSE